MLCRVNTILQLCLHICVYHRGYPQTYCSSLGVFQERMECLRLHHSAILYNRNCPGAAGTVIWYKSKFIKSCSCIQSWPTAEILRVSARDSQASFFTHSVCPSTLQYWSFAFYYYVHLLYLRHVLLWLCETYWRP